MTEHTNVSAPPMADRESAVFPPESVETFARLYPETPHVLRHHLRANPLMELEALAQLAERLPQSCIEYNRGDLPIGVDGKPGTTGLSIGETIRRVHAANSWAVIKNIERDDAYRALLLALLAELEPVIARKTGAMLRPQGFVFISSPDAVTPYHFDPEHNILLQLTGSKVMTQFPPGDARFAPDEVHEAYHTGGPRELRWDDELMAGAREFAIGPGEAVHVPVMAPHFVRNGSAASISLSITWRSEWSFEESEARAFNSLLRKAGLRPGAPRRWPGRNRARALGWKLWRRLRR
jgi:hypothetical protein